MAAGCVPTGGDSPNGLRVVVAAAPQFLKSALRDWLYESYSLIRITMMSHLRWLSPLWCLTAPPSPRGIGRATKGKRLYGQARRLTSPDLHILCRMCTVDNKAPQSNPFTQRIAKNKVPPPGGRWWRQPPKGDALFEPGPQEWPHSDTTTFSAAGAVAP